MTLTKDIGKKLRKVREVKGFTQENMATEMNISPRHYSRIENGQIDIKLSFLEYACNVLEIEPLQLFGFDERYFFKQCSNGVGKNITVNNIPDNVIKLLENRIIKLEQELSQLRN